MAAFVNRIGDITLFEKLSDQEGAVQVQVQCRQLHDKE